MIPTERVVPLFYQNLNLKMAFLRAQDTKNPNKRLGSQTIAKTFQEFFAGTEREKRKEQRAV